MRTFALLLVLFPSCSMIGHATEGSVTAAGVIATAAVATPVVGFVSWPAWRWAGEYSARWVSGTESQPRLKAKGGLRVPDVSGGSAGEEGAVGWMLGGNMNLLLIALAVWLFVGGGWETVKAWKDRKWEDNLNTKREEHLKRTVALEKQLERIAAQQEILLKVLEKRGPGG